MTQVELIPSPEGIPDTRVIPCKVCGRRLTAPRSRELGIGPACARRMAGSTARANCESSAPGSPDAEPALHRYADIYGTLLVDLKTHRVALDALDRDFVWGTAGHNHRRQIEIYSEILEELLDGWDDDIVRTVEETDFGCKAYLLDGWVLVVDADGTFFYEV